MTERQRSRGDDTGGFQPINKAHSIVEIMFFVSFSQELPHGAIAALQSLREEFKADLPRYNELKTVRFNFAGNVGEPALNQVVYQMVGGFELQRIKPDGTVEWMLRVAEN
jgi:hypothetical protein